MTPIFRGSFNILQLTCLLFRSHSRLLDLVTFADVLFISTRKLTNIWTGRCSCRRHADPAVNREGSRVRGRYRWERKMASTPLAGSNLDRLNDMAGGECACDRRQTIERGKGRKNKGKLGPNDTLHTRNTQVQID